MLTNKKVPCPSAKNICMVCMFLYRMMLSDMRCYSSCMRTAPAHVAIAKSNQASISLMQIVRSKSKTNMIEQCVQSYYIARGEVTACKESALH